MSRVDTIARLSALRSPRKIRTSFSGAELMEWSDKDLEWLLNFTRENFAKEEAQPPHPIHAIALDQLRAELALLDAEMIRRQG
jgi:hypothetical protein